MSMEIPAAKHINYSQRNAYISYSLDTRRFIIPHLAADWHELLIPQSSSPQSLSSKNWKIIYSVASTNRADSETN